jgi:ergothioneine biosynthesis protein EgtB
MRFTLGCPIEPCLCVGTSFAFQRLAETPCCPPYLDDAYMLERVGCVSMDGSNLAQRLRRTRALSNTLSAPLTAEDQCVQAMPDASPTKWHLAHTTWFFETFILKAHLEGYREFDPVFGFCFNSYYEAEGARHPRPERGMLSRPSADEVYDYRAHVDEALSRLMTNGVGQAAEIHQLLEIGINHEQQHQELLLMDILALFAKSPLRPAYRAGGEIPQTQSMPHSTDWVEFEGGLIDIGYAGDGFHFDNEGPPHRALVEPFRLCDRLVTNWEWLEFMDAGGYSDARWWLADGWATVQRENWNSPGYFEQRDGRWVQMGLRGLQQVDEAAPVCHVSYFEADAFARFRGMRLPTEFEWEHASSRAADNANDLSVGALTPLGAGASGGLRQMFGDCWEWTQSAYSPYPRYRPPQGAIGEYNGKFMVSQMVLRGASCVTPDGHSRPTYRNFFYPHQRWQFAGVRLADDAS